MAASSSLGTLPVVALPRGYTRSRGVMHAHAQPLARRALRPAWSRPCARCRSWPQRPPWRCYARLSSTSSQPSRRRFWWTPWLSRRAPWRWHSRLRYSEPLLRSQGFSAAFGLIFVSEIGDKTFFIAALLAMRRGRAVVLAGAVSALALMTGISVALGRLFSRLPDSLSSSLPLGEYCAAALLLFFGIKALKDALALPRSHVSGDEELDAAAAVVDQAEAGSRSGMIAGFLQTFALIFVAEWGDRSMLATIALGAAQNPWGVFAGAVGGHALATLLAVLGGALLSKRISERAVGITGGVLFLVFAAATLAGVF